MHGLGFREYMVHEFIEPLRQKIKLGQMFFLYGANGGETTTKNIQLFIIKFLFLENSENMIIIVTSK